MALEVTTIIVQRCSSIVFGACLRHIVEFLRNDCSKNRKHKIKYCKISQFIPASDFIFQRLLSKPPQKVCAKLEIMISHRLMNLQLVQWSLQCTHVRWIVAKRGYFRLLLVKDHRGYASYIRIWHAFNYYAWNAIWFEMI